MRSPFASRYNQFYSRQSFTWLKNNRPALSHRLAANLMNLWPDQTSDLFNRCPWDQLIDILVNQCAYNHQIKSCPSHDHHRLKLFAGQNAQDTEPLMMTDWTAHRRGALISTICQPDDDILLVEDPYLLSLVLAKRGFKRLTVVSHDPQHLAALADAAEQMGLKGRIVTEPCQYTALQPIGQFKLRVVEGPADATKATQLLAAAEQLDSSGRQTPVMLSIHLMGLLKAGLHAFRTALAEQDIAVDSLHLGCNGFALPYWSAKRLQTLGRMATGMEILSLPTSRISYFVSDAMILKYR